MFEHRPRGVAEPEAADDDIEVRALERRQSEPRQFDLGCGELARHQKFVAEFDLIDVGAGGKMPAATQAEHAHRCRAKIQFFEIQAHALTDLTAALAAAQIATDWPHSLTRSFCPALAKAGSERVEERDSRPDVLDLSHELQELVLSIWY